MNEIAKIERVIQDINGDASPEKLRDDCQGLNLDLVGVHGRTPLMVASAEGKLEAVEVLLQVGASVHARGQQGEMALHAACANGEEKVVECLLLSGADVNAVTEVGVSPLMCAAAWGYINVVQILLRNGAETLMTDIFGATAADIAREKGENTAAEVIDASDGLGTTA